MRCSLHFCSSGSGSQVPYLHLWASFIQKQGPNTVLYHGVTEEPHAISELVFVGFTSMSFSKFPLVFQGLGALCENGISFRPSCWSHTYDDPQLPVVSISANYLPCARLGDICSLVLRSLHWVSHVFSPLGWFFFSAPLPRLTFLFLKQSSFGYDDLLCGFLTLPRLWKSQFFPDGFSLLSLSGCPTQFWLWQ